MPQAKGPGTRDSRPETEEKIAGYQLGAIPRIPQYCSAPNVLPLFFFHISLKEEYKIAFFGKLCLMLAIAACWCSWLGIATPLVCLQRILVTDVHLNAERRERGTNPWDGHPVSVTTVVLPPAASDTILTQLATKGPAFSAGVFPSKKAWQLMAQ